MISEGGLQLTNAKSSALPWGKLLLILIVVAMVAIPLWVRQKRAVRNRELATAIQSSPLFAKPVTVEASSRRDDIPNPEAFVLRNAGLLTIDHEPLSTPASATPYWPEPNAILIRTMRRTNLDRILNQPVVRLIPKDTAASGDWQRFEDREHHRHGWTVPVGTRELIALTSIEGAGTDTVQVQFTWKWKPNQVGRHFDEHAQHSDRHWGRRSNPRLSSEYPFKGTAELSRTGNRWEVKTIKWSLNMSERVY